MLHLVYTMQLTNKANMKAFWSWLQEREDWFYEDLDMAKDPRWFICTFGQDVHALEHFISFENEAAWGDYRSAVSSKYASCEDRRAEQYEWWNIVAARLLNDAPLKKKRIVSHNTNTNISLKQ